MPHGISPIALCSRVQVLFLHFKLVFSYTTQWAYPIFGDIGPCSAWSYVVVGVANFRVINITAYYAYIFFHNSHFFSCISKFIKLHSTSHS